MGHFGLDVLPQPAMEDLIQPPRVLLLSSVINVTGIAQSATYGQFLPQNPRFKPHPFPLSCLNTDPPHTTTSGTTAGAGKRYVPNQLTWHKHGTFPCIFRAQTLSNHPIFLRYRCINSWAAGAKAQDETIPSTPVSAFHCPGREQQARGRAVKGRALPRAARDECPEPGAHPRPPRVYRTPRVWRTGSPPAPPGTY